MTVDWDTWAKAKIVMAEARKYNLDEIEALDRAGFLLSRRARNDLHCDFIDRMLILLRGPITPYQLHQLTGQEHNQNAANAHAGFIFWLERMREDFE